MEGQIQIALKKPDWGQEDSRSTEPRARNKSTGGEKGEQEIQGNRNVGGVDSGIAFGFSGHRTSFSE